MFSSSVLGIVLIILAVTLVGTALIARGISVLFALPYWSCLVGLFLVIGLILFLKE
ncbi:hypothetical protein [Brevibacillus laterosporus]|uniref:Uncharacterized protein n=2 Tax=Brevibacillus laterosporus TaxID=1465 RepID=A0AAP3DLQ3_BRELA|nr:hypothetical protein [Brevibacillus laterosporus]MCZ0810463.1 hypothetical protein [Brevibacillus laterosporus]MCZ0829035.1 hypothetical protein [Brevibacillus laterosporus]